MTEPIQPALDPHAAAVPERTPGVLHEDAGFDFRLILWVAGGLVVTTVVMQLVVWWLFVGYEIPHAPPPEGLSSLALEDSQRPLGERLLDVPPPHLEGIEPESSVLIVRDGGSDERRFFVAPKVHVLINDKPARLFELQEGQAVTVTYHVPGGVAGGLGIATSIRTPPVEAASRSAPELPGATQLVNATVLKVEPRSIEAARAWATVQMDRYGWADRQKGIVRIPVATAMEEILKSKEFRSDGRKKASGRPVTPGRSNSGRGSEGDQP